jgi:hypothetical protein
MPTSRKLLVVAGAVGAVGLLLARPDRSESDETDEESEGSECPICGKSVDPRGLSGHLQFGHDVSGEDVSDVISSGSAQDVEVTNEST